MAMPDPDVETGTDIEGDAPDVEPTVETDDATVTDGAELERTLGLSGGLAIGIGTMIGAGIFVLPGLAAGDAGPAAAGPFAIGGIVALLVALPAMSRYRGCSNSSLPSSVTATST